MRSKWAFHVFVLSYAGFVVSVIYTYGFSNGLETNGMTAVIMTGVIAASCVFFIWYARFATRRGLLR
jgi:Na+-driven multidrug efflux pump